MSKQELIRVVLEDCSFERTEESKNYAPTGMALNIDRHFTVNLVEGRSTERALFVAELRLTVDVVEVDQDGQRTGKVLMIAEAKYGAGYNISAMSDEDVTHFFYTHVASKLDTICSGTISDLLSRSGNPPIPYDDHDYYGEMLKNERQKAEARQRVEFEQP
tara:strand:- start:11459 stop:11941 length:483 start_codon:yes stop_codon:yes gene_type:complete